jgi:hypothetical protein
MRQENKEERRGREGEEGRVEVRERGTFSTPLMEIVLRQKLPEGLATGDFFTNVPR